MITNEEIESLGFTIKTTNRMCWWFEKEVFFDMPHSESYRVVALELCFDPKGQSIKIEGTTNFAFQQEILYEGHCRSLEELNLILTLIGYQP
jgi:hypothetical protein